MKHTIGSPRTREPTHQATEHFQVCQSRRINPSFNRSANSSRFHIGLLSVFTTVSLLFSPSSSVISFSFTVLDSRILYDQETFCETTTRLPNSTAAVVLAMYQKNEFRIQPSGTTHIGNRWIEELLGSRGSPPNKVNIAPEVMMPLIIVIQRTSISKCKISKLLRWNMPTAPATGSENDLITGVLNRFQSSPAVYWDLSNWVIPTGLNFSRVQTAGNDLPILMHVLDQAPSASEWNDPRLYRLFMNGMYPSVDPWRFYIWDVFTSGRNVWPQYDGAHVSNYKEYMIATRMYDDQGFGFKIENNKKAELWDYNAYTLRTAPFALIYIFNVSQIQSPGNQLTITWHTQKAPNAGIVSDSTFKFYFSGGSYRVDVNHKVYHSSAPSSPISTLGPITKVLFAPAAIKGDTISFGVSTDHYYEDLPGQVSANYNLISLVRYSLFSSCLEPNPITFSSYPASNEKHFVDRLSGTLGATLGVFASNLYGSVANHGKTFCY